MRSGLPWVMLLWPRGQVAGDAQQTITTNNGNARSCSSKAPRFTESHVSEEAAARAAPLPGLTHMYAADLSPPSSGTDFLTATDSEARVTR